MKELLFGPSGAGKTYLSSEFRKMGVAAIDADTIDGLSSWYNGEGNKVSYPDKAGKEFLDNHSFLWDRAFLKDYLNKHPDIYIFGAAGNVFETIDLFDIVYFLKVPAELQKERLVHPTRENPMGNTEYQRESAVLWGKELEEKAKELNIPFIDATLTPQEIYNYIKR